MKRFLVDGKMILRLLVGLLIKYLAFHFFLLFSVYCHLPTLHLCLVFRTQYSLISWKSRLSFLPGLCYSNHQDVRGGGQDNVICSELQSIFLSHSSFHLSGYLGIWCLGLLKIIPSLYLLLLVCIFFRHWAICFLHFAYLFTITHLQKKLLPFLICN